MDTTIEQDGFIISSNHETEEAMRTALEPVEDPEPPPATAEKSAADKPAADRPKIAKPRNDPQARIDQATARLKEAERRAEKAEAELASERRARAEPAKAAPAAEPVNKETAKAEWERYKAMPNAPKQADFEDFSDWGIAMNLFIADTRYEERARADADAASARTQHQTWLSRLADARKKDPTYDSRLKSDTPATQQMREIIARSDIGPDLLMHLSDHQDIAQRLTTLHPLEVAEHMGRLEGELKSRLTAAHSGPASAPAISAAKPLIKPVSGSPIVSDEDVDEGELPLEEFHRRGNARETRQRSHPRH